MYCCLMQVLFYEVILSLSLLHTFINCVQKQKWEQEYKEKSGNDTRNLGIIPVGVTTTGVARRHKYVVLTYVELNEDPCRWSLL